MEFLIGVLGLLLLGGLYVGLGLADRGREACGDCSLADDPENCGSCPLVVAADVLEELREQNTAGVASTEPESRREADDSRSGRLPMWRPSGE